MRKNEFLIYLVAMFLSIAFLPLNSFSQADDGFAKRKSEWIASQLERRQKEIDKHPELKKDLSFINIMAGRLDVGMDRTQVFASWGKPDDINKTVTVLGEFEQWVYLQTSYEKEKYANFEDGILTSYQT